MKECTTARPDTADCPAWCEDSHAHDRDIDFGQRLHKGPTFGQIDTWWSEREADTPFTATVSDEFGELGEDLTAAQLRRLGSDALAAAQWIEDQQRLPADPVAVAALRTAIEGAGFTVEGLRDDMSRAEVRHVAEQIGRKLADLRQHHGQQIEAAS